MEVNLTKIHCKHKWKCHNETPCTTIMYTNKNVFKRHKAEQDLLTDCFEAMWEREFTSGFQIPSLGWDLDREGIFTLE
jgi:hypothetical protein